MMMHGLANVKIAQYIFIHFTLAILSKSDQKFKAHEQRLAHFLTIFNLLNFTKLNITVQNHVNP